MKSHFKPYKITKQSQLGLWIELPVWRKWLGITTWRLIPFLILSLLIFLLTSESSHFPMPIMTGLLFIGLVALFMLFVKIIWRFTITSAFIEIASFKILGLHHEKYFLGSALWIEIKISDHIRGGAIFYNLVFKNGKKIQFIQQPTLTVNREDMEFVGRTLRSITNLETKVTGRFSGDP